MLLTNIMFCCENMQFLREKNFKQTIPPVKIEDGEQITYDKATAALKRTVNFFSALQASDGHWPAENTGEFFFLPPLVSIFLHTLSSNYHTTKSIYIIPSLDLIACLWDFLIFFIKMQVMCLYITGDLYNQFTVEHRKEMLRYFYCHQVTYF